VCPDPRRDSDHI
jgi:hypothetical protein